MKEAEIIIALGSNEQAEEHLDKAKKYIQALFPNILFSEALWTEPIGIRSARFLNCVGVAMTGMDYSTICQMLKSIEHSCGDRQEDRRRNIVRMDIDLLRYGHRREHKKDWQRPYIQQLIKEIHVDISGKT